MSKYAIHVVEENLDLIQVLNGGVRPLTEDKETYFVFETDPVHITKNPDIKSVNQLYDRKGYLRDVNLVIL